MIPPTVQAVDGNAEVRSALEHFTALAAKGTACHLLMAMLYQPEKGGGDPPCTAAFIGSVMMDKAAKRAWEKVGVALDTSIENCAPPERDLDLGADYACYNVALSPLSYDFVPWLIDAEMRRVRAGAPAPLKVAFWMGKDGNGLRGDKMRQQMLDHVVRPMLPMIGAIEDPKAIGAQTSTVWTYKSIADAARAGEKVPLFQPSAAAFAFVEATFGMRAPVTITLRECENWPHRNSNIQAWLKFAGDLAAEGERVVIVRDTAKANDTFTGYETCPEASRNLDIRMALYETAKCNLFVSNGPASMAWFGTAPWLDFVTLTDDAHPYIPNRESFWRDHMGIRRGEQWPWAKTDQHIVWAPDTYENIVRAWRQFAPYLAKKSAGTEHLVGVAHSGALKQATAAA